MCWVCNFHVISLFLMLLRDHFGSRYLHITTARVKCCVAAVKSYPVLHFSVVNFFLSFGIIESSTIQCWELSKAQPVLGRHEGCCNFSLSFINRVCNFDVILLFLMLPRDHFQIFVFRKMAMTECHTGHTERVKCEMVISLVSNYKQVSEWSSVH
jgi:hypothetical protein